MRTALFVLIFTLPISAQRLAWEQDYPSNPAPLIWRAYFDHELPTATADLLVDVSCAAQVETFDWACQGTLRPRTWTTVRISVENAVGESLPSNTISYQVPLPAIPSAPKSLRVP